MSAHEAVDRAYERRLADRYRLTKVIGSGGTGTVWAAVDEVLGRKVAVKDVVAPPWLSDDERRLLRERTLREAQAACRIDHPNVVTVYDVIEHDGRPWIIMQLVEARSLAEIIDEDGPCSPSTAADIGLQVLGALQAAHAHGILHRDVKPSNVLVDGRWAVLTDFGIATIHGEAALTAPDTLVGAPSYIAPERVRGEPASPASDLWSLGATLYTAVEGRPPHLREGVMPILTAVATDEPDPARRSGALAPLLTALLRKDPAQRPSAAEVERSLRRIALLTAGLDGDDGDPAHGVNLEPENTQQLSAPSDRVQRQRRERQRSSRRGQAVVAAAAVAVLAVLLGTMLAREGSVPGFPSRQPAGVPASTVPVTSVPGGGAPSSPAGGNPVAPIDQDSSTTLQPTDEAPPEAGPGPGQQATTEPRGAAPTNTQPPPAQTTTTTETTTSQPAEPSETTVAVTSVLP